MCRRADEGNWFGLMAVTINSQFSKSNEQQVQNCSTSSRRFAPDIAGRRSAGLLRHSRRSSCRSRAVWSPLSTALCSSAPRVCSAEGKVGVRRDHESLGRCRLSVSPELPERAQSWLHELFT